MWYFLNTGISAVASLVLIICLIIACVDRVASILIHIYYPVIGTAEQAGFFLQIYSVLVHGYLQLQLRKAFIGKQSFDFIPRSEKVPLCRP